MNREHTILVTRHFYVTITDEEFRQEHGYRPTKQDLCDHAFGSERLGHTTTEVIESIALPPAVPAIRRGRGSY